MENAYANGIKSIEALPKIDQPLKLVGVEGKYDIKVNVEGGGIMKLIYKV